MARHADHRDHTDALKAAADPQLVAGAWLNPGRVDFDTTVRSLLLGVGG